MLSELLTVDQQHKHHQHQHPDTGINICKQAITGFELLQIYSNTSACSMTPSLTTIPTNKCETLERFRAKRFSFLTSYQIVQMLKIISILTISDSMPDAPTFFIQNSSDLQDIQIHETCSCLRNCWFTWTPRPLMGGEVSIKGEGAKWKFLSL